MNQRSLRRLMSQRIKEDEIAAWAAELREMQDRAAAIVAATAVEDVLYDVLKNSMAKLSKSEHDYLFLGDGPLARFSSKIRLSRAFKIIDKRLAADLETIKAIRDVFAHARIAVSFDTPEISGRIEKITMTDMLTGWEMQELAPDFYKLFKAIQMETPREKFLGHCLLFSWLIPTVASDPFLFEDDD